MGQNRKNILIDALLIVLIGFAAQYFQPEANHITSDGCGYYDYLPSAFIHDDLSRNSDEVPNRIQSIQGYTNYNNGLVNKYHCGTAVLLSPFFLIIKFLFYEPGMTGYEQPFQYAALSAALFYTWLTLIFLRRLLALYNIRPAIIMLTQVALVFGTNVLYYSAVESAFSHVYSLFAVTAFLYFTKRCLAGYKRKHLIWSTVLLALIIIIRPINVLVILFLPFMSDSWQLLLVRMQDVFRDKIGLAISFVAFTAVVAIQIIAWYLQTGNIVVYSYGDERFYFSDPHFWGILFSFRKGLFIYTPVLLLAIVGLIHFIRNKNWYSLAAFILPFAIITYVLSSWWDWVYGHSYGMRAFTEFFPLFFILIAIGANQKSWLSKVPWVAVLLFIPLNLIQTWQYKHYILHWYTMDFHKYAKVFLKTSDPYKGILWKEDVPPEECNTAREFDYGMKQVLPATADTLMNVPYSELARGSDLHAVEISCRNEFSEDSKALIELNIMDSTGTEILWTRGVYLIQFADQELNSMQHGHYWYKPNISIASSDHILIRVFGGDESTQLDTVKIRFCTRKL